MAKITVKGNTSKIKKFFPATEDKSAMLCFDMAEKIKYRSGKEKTIWWKVKVFRNYAKTIYEGLHGDKPVSRFIRVEGELLDEPKSVVGKDGTLITYNTIYVDEIEWLDQKYPERTANLPENTDEQVPEDIVDEMVAVNEEATPWDDR